MIPILERKVQLIGISGYSGAGKNTISEYITHAFQNSYEIAFADPLKYACSELFGIQLPEFYNKEYKEKNNKVWGVSPRKITQFIGTEFFRDRIAQLIPWVGQDFWVHRFMGTLNSRLVLAEKDPEGTQIIVDLDPTDTIVIPDVRFQNEYDFIQVNGGLVINVQRNGCTGNIGISNHASEQGVKISIVDQNFVVMNNGTWDELYEQVDKVLEYTINALNYQFIKYEK
jgi:hypothetical protein